MDQRHAQIWIAAGLASVMITLNHNIVKVKRVSWTSLLPGRRELTRGDVRTDGTLCSLDMILRDSTTEDSVKLTSDRVQHQLGGLFKRWRLSPQDDDIVFVVHG